MSHVTTRNLSYTILDTPTVAYLAAPAQGGPGIVVLHAWWGLTPFFKQVCDRLAEAGFAALAPDMNNGQIAQTVDEAKAIMEARNWDLTEAVVLDVGQRIGLQPEARGNSIGAVGFSMGAAWAVILSAMYPAAVRAVSMFYGIGDVNFSKTQAAYQGHYVRNDEWEPEEGINDMESKMRAAGREVTVYTYPDATHWFFEEDRPAYNAPHAAQAWERTVRFFRSGLMDKRAP